MSDLVRKHPVPPFSTALPVTPSSPRAARMAVNDWLATEGCDHLGHVAAVVVSELVTNAVIHGRDPVRLSLSRVDGVVRVEVFDGSTALPRRRTAAPDDSGGRGLQIVESYSADWGSERVDGGKVTWARITADR